MNVVEFALCFVNEITKEDNEVKKAFRARARDLYTMAHFNGILPTLAFAYSKAKEERIKEMLKGKDVKIEHEDKSYALYLISIIRYLKEIENIKEVDGSIDSIFNKIEENEELMSSKIFVLMNWLKLFSEAKIRSE